MAYKWKKKGKTVAQIFDFEGVFNKHIDRLNFLIAQDAEFGIPTIQKAVTLLTMTKQLENQLSFLLDDEYTIELKKRVNIPDIKSAASPKGFLEFFKNLSDWLQLLFAYAYTKKIIKAPLEYDEFMKEEEYEEGEEGD